MPQGPWKNEHGIEMMAAAMPFLDRPSEKYRESYIEAVREFEAEGSRADGESAKLMEDFGGYVTDLLRRADRATQDAHLVPETFWWLMDGDDFIGVVKVRHELTESLMKRGGHIGYTIRPSKRRLGYGTLILKLALEKAKELGIRRALVTCSAENIGSRKIIEANGGVLEDESEMEVEGRTIMERRYWIDIP